MRALGEAYPDEAFVQEVVAQMQWGQNVILLGMPVTEVAKDPGRRGEGRGHAERMTSEREGRSVQWAGPGSGEFGILLPVRRGWLRSGTGQADASVGETWWPGED